MKLPLHFKVLFSLLIGTVAYTAISGVAGLNGVYAYRKLVEEKKAVAQRTSEIQSVNEGLALEYISLLKDKDVIGGFARALGYVNDGEVIVKINGLPPYQRALYDIGTARKRTSIPTISESSCKIVGVIFGVLTFIVLAFV